MRTGLSLSSWCAYSPEYCEHSVTSLLNQDTAVDVSFLPAMKRRRLSRLSRLSLRMAHNVAPEFQGHCVFGSQHGELVTTHGLLQSIVANDVVSPAGFTASVHNTAVGLHSINCRNTASCTSIAAGVDTLAMCFVEAFGILAQQPSERVLVVYADDSVPAPFADFVNPNHLRGLAALVSLAQQQNRPAIGLELEKSLNDDEMLDDDPINPVIKGLLGESSVCNTRGEAGDWSWRFNVQ